MSNGTALVLVVCDSGGKSSRGFQWPLVVGESVSASNWMSNKHLADGLYGWLYGSGLMNMAFSESTATWLVVEVQEDELIELSGCCKFPSAIVRYAGDSKSAADYLWEHEPRSRALPVHGAYRANMNDRAEVEVGLFGYAIAGVMGSATADACGCAISGEWGQSITRALGVSISNENGTAIAGNNGCAIARSNGKAIAGFLGNAITGEGGISQAGTCGVAIAGLDGSATAGRNGLLSILHLDGHLAITRKVAVVGENGIKPDVLYKLDKNGDFVISTA